MTSPDASAHEMYCNCYGGAECKCICAGYSGAIDELSGKLKIAVTALEKIRQHKTDIILRRTPTADPALVSTTFKLADQALSEIKDSIYG